MTACLFLGFMQRMRLSAKSQTLVLGLLAWMFAAVLSVAANGAGNLDAIALLALLALYALFANATSYHMTDLSSLRAIRKFLIAFMIIGTCLAVTQIATGSGFVEAGNYSTQRAIGSDVHPVSFAIQMVAALIGLEVIRIKRRLPLSLGHLILGSLGLLALYLTYARTAWVMLAVSAGFAIFLRASPIGRVLIAAAVTLAGVALSQMSGRFSDLSSLPFFLQNFSFADAAFDYRYVDNSVSWRIVNWSLGFQQAIEQPWLGFGAGQSATSSHFQLEMHNIFLETFFEGGIVGLLAFLLVLAGVFQLHRSLPRATPADRHARLLANGFGLSLLLAVTFSTSFVDQLMSVLLYLLMLSATCVPAANDQPAASRNAAILAA
ncbi:MAG: O-antigen ligase family protein [Marinosulfonomonas sp.]|nr:O-antigen ligase family protein [Marinosulfonomonas sp.]